MVQCQVQKQYFIVSIAVEPKMSSGKSVTHTASRSLFCVKFNFGRSLHRQNVCIEPCTADVKNQDYYFGMWNTLAMTLARICGVEWSAKAAATAHQQQQQNNNKNINNKSSSGWNWANVIMAIWTRSIRMQTVECMHTQTHSQTPENIYISITFSLCLWHAHT